jgi:hypothetical protein
MRLYGVTRDDVLDCIENPEWQEREAANSKVYVHAFSDGALISWRRRAGRWLEVIYVDEGEDRVIITLGPRDDDPPEEAR